MPKTWRVYMRIGAAAWRARNFMACAASCRASTVTVKRFSPLHSASPFLLHTATANARKRRRLPSYDVAAAAGGINSDSIDGSR